MSSDAPRLGRTEWLLLLALSVLWGGSFFLAKLAVREVPPLALVLARVAIAALALHAVVLASGRRMPRSAPAWRAFAAMGLLNNAIPFTLIFWGQTRIASGLASVLNATTPLFTLVVAHFLTDDERLGARRVAGVLLGVLGVAVVLGPGPLRGLGGDAPGQLAVLGAAVSYAFAGAFGRRFRRMGIAPLEVECGQVTASAAMLLPAVLALAPPWRVPRPGAVTVAAVLALGLASTALAYVLFFRILAVAGAANVMLVTLLVPVTAILLGAAVLGERLLPRQAAGAAVLAVALAVVDGRGIEAIGRRIASSRTGRPSSPPNYSG
jgi:drug/metabolite transporter (DMT)-like permease